MSRFAEPMARLIDELKKLPGVGSKSAQRLAFHILRSSEEDATALAGAIHEVKASLRLCSVCNNITDVDPCAYCSSATRNQRIICVVEEPTNIAAIEKTRAFNGVYHVLHGALSPLHGVGPEHLRLGNLARRVENGTAAEFMQSRSPVGCGPSGNRCPRCASQRLHTTSVRDMPSVRSVCSSTAPSDAGCVKLGQPVPESNLSSARNSSCPQHTHLYTPGVW